MLRGDSRQNRASTSPSHIASSSLSVRWWCFFAHATALSLRAAGASPTGMPALDCSPDCWAAWISTALSLASERKPSAVLLSIAAFSAWLFPEASSHCVPIPPGRGKRGDRRRQLERNSSKFYQAGHVSIKNRICSMAGQVEGQGTRRN